MIKPVSGACNMRCTYCFYADEMKNRAEAVHARMTDETLEKLVRRVFSYAEGRVMLAFQGGEPTLAGAEFYKKLLKLERKYNSRHIPVQHALQTNGLVLDDEMIDVLKEGNFLVGVSMDGTAALHDARRIDAAGQGTYQRIRENTEKLKQAGIEFNILCVVDEAVASQPEAVMEALEPYIYLQFIACLDPLTEDKREGALTAEAYGEFLSRTYTRYAALLRAGKPISIRTFDNWLGMLAGFPPESCGFSGRCSVNYLVESNGSVYPCDFYALDEWLLGDINRVSFYALEKSEVQQRFIARSLPVPEGCKTCPYYALCRCGCCRDRDVQGQLGENRLCAGYRLFFERHLTDMKQLAAMMFASRRPTP